MIIIGYPGVGKSTAMNMYSTIMRGNYGFANTNGGLRDRLIQNAFIPLDLESSFFHDKESTESWVKRYCECAITLSISGYTVFTSAHKEVQEYFRIHAYGQTIALCYPDRNIYEDWTILLKNRMKSTAAKKDEAAFLRCTEKFFVDIDEMKNDKAFDHIVVRGVSNYRLESSLEMFLTYYETVKKNKGIGRLSFGNFDIILNTIKDTP